MLISVCGVDADAQKNWNSFCQQDYQNYEVLFGVMNLNDPAVPILKELVAKYPNRAKLVFCLEERGINHKFSNLTHLLEAAQHEIIVLTDSDIWVKPEYLHTVTSPLADPKIGIVTCGYLGHQPNSLPAMFASFGRCIDFIPSVLIARSLERGLKFALGATIATRKSVLEEIGGLKSVVNRIGCDYYIGNMVAAAGYRVELSQYILETNNGLEGLQHLLQRELRWARMSRWNRGWLYYTIAFTYGTVYCIPLLILSDAAQWAVIICLITVFIRIAQAVICIYSMGCTRLLWGLWTLPIHDFKNFAIWLAGTSGRTIHWRGRHLRILSGGFLEEKASS
ncbi:glycosyltransferase [Aetokthonos hydrillicola Thurmond2011]|uniref:Glycosyltransferase n=1 Tax=Aetokthonos hydrillicola Thurmond2011 TaxID=2712845 RepID=A0AAP5IA26_9CYAN|nr:glycosyltransferase [Aetokthonos hydrillicola]MDR9897685.1 glycosyltransferase [Aetokthonos hydrillicola Thurmond2011]